MRKVKTHWEVRVTDPYYRDENERTKVTQFAEEAEPSARLYAMQKVLEVRDHQKRTIELVKVETHESEPEVFTRARAEKALMGA
jgi:hypothetical protein